MRDGNNKDSLHAHDVINPMEGEMEIAYLLVGAGQNGASLSSMLSGAGARRDFGSAASPSADP